MKKLPPLPTRRTQRRSVPTFSGRPEVPVVVRHPRDDVPWSVVVLVIVLLLAAFSGFSKLPSLSFSLGENSSSYSRQFEIRNISLTPVSSAKSRVVWQVGGQVMNATRNMLGGPRVKIELVRGDGSVAAQGVADYTRRSLPERSGVSLNYQLETGANESVQARVTILPPSAGAYDRDGDND